MRSKSKSKNKNKKYYLDLDIIRNISCIAVLLYHIGYLKGGFLAVCTFFVLSGYLSCISAYKKEDFSLIKYYKDRVLHIYIPLLLVVFLSVFIVSVIPSIGWLNLKPETLSVIGGYNNFWQLSANLDYFARHVSSPFMHFWYIAILLQFDLVFPILFIILKKIGDKIHKVTPVVIIEILSLLSTGYFYYMSIKDNIMVTYYDTFCRIFSILFGLLIGWIHCAYHNDVLKVLEKKYSKIIFYSYLVILILMFILVDSTSPFFNIAMILSTLISCRLISYGTIESKKDFDFKDKVIMSLSNVSYEIYLVQYPVIFLFQNIVMKDYLRVLCIVPLIVFLSYFIHFILNKEPDKRLRIPKYVLGACTLVLVIIGAYQFVIAKDHTSEMKALESQLNANQELMREKQEEYSKKLQEEQDKWNKILEEVDMDDEKLAQVIHNLPVVGVGDSVMLGAVTSLYETFPNGYFDAAVSRTDYEAAGILQGVKSKGLLGDPIIINLGTNGQCGITCQNDILRVVENRKVFWINVTNDNDVHVNAGLDSLANNHDNVTVIDWKNASTGHSEYFVADGIHLTGTGMKYYSEVIYNSIYDTYSNYYKNKKEEILKQQKEELDKKINFYGNELLLNAYSTIEKKFDNAVFNTNKELNYEILKNKINEDLNNKNLPKRNVILLDNSFNLEPKEYVELINMFKDYHFYIVDLNYNSYPKADNVTMIDFDRKNNMMPDGLHLTDKGNKVLVKNIYNDIYKDKSK